MAFMTFQGTFLCSICKIKIIFVANYVFILLKNVTKFNAHVVEQRENIKTY